MKTVVKMAVVLFVIAGLLTGCNTFFCKFTPDQRARVQATMHSLQDGYDITVALLKMAPDVRVQTAVALTDAALSMVGSVLAATCPDDKAVGLAEATAAQAVKAKDGVLGK